MDDLDIVTYLSEGVQDWQGVAVSPYRFGGIEFTLGTRELGHLHPDGTLNIPFDKSTANHLIDANKAERHPIYPESGWVIFRVHSRRVAHHALWLLKLSYLHHRLQQVKTQARIIPETLAYLKTIYQELELTDPVARLFDDRLRAIS